MKGQLSFRGLDNQFEKFPGTRYMGSKNKIIGSLWEILSKYEFNSFFDAFGGSNVVGYFMKSKGKRVVSNDFMSMSYFMSKALIENEGIKLDKKEVGFLLNNENKYDFIQRTFEGIYFTGEENRFLDKVRGNINSLDCEFKQALAISALVRACMKKRPRGIFTYTGNRYNDGRKDITKSLVAHFEDNISLFNDAVFSNNTKCQAMNGDIFQANQGCDLVYLDPPYYNPKGDNDYVRRYHFVEGLTKYWEGLEIQEHTITKKFKSYKSPFSVKNTTYHAFEQLIEQYKNSIIAISYSSNSRPTKEELVNIMGKHLTNVVTHEIDHTYSFGTQKNNKSNRVKEYVFVGYNR